VKGNQLRLLVFRKTVGGVEELRDGARVANNDAIQLCYYSAEQQYGTILSLDGRGVITQHLPERGAEAAELVQGRVVPLPTAFHLDDAPLGEIFFFIASSQPFSLRPVLDAIGREANVRSPRRQLALPSDYHQFTILLRKESR
jgi:hypothetical protein